MKVLILTPRIYEKSLKKFQKNKNGFTMMVSDIAKSLSSFDNVFVASYAFTKEERLSHSLIFVKRTVWQLLKTFSFRYLTKGLRAAVSIKAPLKLRLKYLYYTLSQPFFRSIIQQIRPDVVSIHGISYASEQFIQTCCELKIQYTVTLHGLLGLNEKLKVTTHDRQAEKNFLITAEKENIPVSVISSGIKRRIVQMYGLKNGDNISVIPNGTAMRPADSEFQIDVRNAHNIGEDQFIAVCVGNITPNKNQVQVVHSYKLLPEEVRNRLTVLFLGRECDKGQLRELIKSSGYENSLIFCDFVSRDKIGDYYHVANINLFPSLNDGFGLPIVEAFIHGIPTVSFADLDAIEDVYHASAMRLSCERTDKAYAEAIVSALDTVWDWSFIQQWGNRFSLQKTALNYHDFFEKGRIPCECQKA
ncbi:MAG: glycosyltransferase family 4 protein [Clostridia bacterium]|nr:glycosyltransferase family 4 protein [Clostridia bacterium]